MQLRDSLHLSLTAITAYRMRSALTTLGIAIGIAAVVLLTAIGEGIHRFILTEFTQFGTHLIGVTPGKTTTAGVSGAVVSNIRPLTLDDAQAMRQIPQVEYVVPVVQGNAEVESATRSRWTIINGVGHAAPKVWQFDVAQGRFLPDDDPNNSRALAVLGAKVRTELFPNSNPLGQYIRVGGHRYRVIGIMEPKGQLLGFDLDDAIYIPTSRAMEVFNRESLMEIDLLYSANASAETIANRTRQMLTARHDEEDFTIVTQEEMLETLSSILDVLTLAVAAIGAISLFVGGIGILTIMTIAVSERTNEIGLLRAMGAESHQILMIFLTEAITLGALGGISGLILGLGSAEILNWVVPGLPVHASLFYVLLAVAVALAIGLIAGIAPARKAAGLDPVVALRTE